MSDSGRQEVLLTPPSAVISRNGQSALRDIISVLDYGAKGDGVTDDTTPIQNAINAVTVNGGVLLFPAGLTFYTNQLTPKNNVIVWAYGATFKLNPAAAQAMFYAPSGTLTGFKILGATFTGTGAETTAQMVFQVNTPAICADVEIRDTTVTNWASGPYYFGNAIRVRALDNTMRTVCTAAGTNAINIVAQANGVVAQEAIISGNIIEGCNTYGIAYVNTGNLTDQECRVIITDNYCQGAATSGVGSGGIDLEFATASIGRNSKFVIAGNVCTYTGNQGVTVRAITVNGASGTNADTANRIVVADNVVDSTAAGILVNASRAAVTGNVVNAGVGSALVIGKSAANPNQYITVTGNVLHNDTTITDNAVLWINQATHCKVQGNLVIVDTGAASSTPNGIGVSGTTASFLEVTDNAVINAPRHGILVGGTDIDIRNNRVYNPSSQAAGFHGIFLNTVSGNVARVAGNTIVDDRAGSAQMTNGINASSSTTVNVFDNTILGYTNVPINGTVGVKRGNRYSTGAVNGQAVLVAGTVTVNTTEVVTGDSIILSPVAGGGTRGIVQVGTIVNKTSFVINSIQPGTASTLQNADTSTVYWEIRH